jgi:hypothetical protein
VDGGTSSQWHTVRHAHLEAEVLFYNKLRSKVDIIAPTGLYAAVNQESYNSIIILRDLKDEGGLPRCWISPSHQRRSHILRQDHQGDPQHGRGPFVSSFSWWSLIVAAEMRTLAKLHGKFYQVEDPDVMKLSLWGEGFELYDQLCDVERAAKNGWKASKSVIPAELYSAEDEIWPLTVQSYKRNNILPQSLVQ